MPQKSLAINTSFDPSEWQMKPFMGRKQTKMHITFKTFETKYIFIRRTRKDIHGTLCRPYVFLSQTVTSSSFFIRASIE